MVAETAPAAAPEVVVTETSAPISEDPTLAPEPEKPTDVHATAEEPAAAEAAATEFKEESNLVADLEDPEKKALDELKLLVAAALANNEFVAPPPPPPKIDTTKPAAEPVTVTDSATETTAADTVTESAAEPAPTVEPANEEAVAAVEASSETAAAAAAVSEEKVVIEATVVPVASLPPLPAEEVAPAGSPEVAPAGPPEEVHIWGVPLLGDEKSDTVLLKFLRARDFKVKEALAMINHAVVWRKQFGIEELLSEDLGVAPELEKVVFNHGHDKEGHPVCYNVYGEFQDKELYGKAFGDEEKRGKFLKWRIQFLEKGIRELLDFAPEGVSTMVQVTDLKNVAGPGKRELRQATKKALTLLQDSYPEFVAKQIFINVPWWYLAYNRMISSVFTPRSKSKFVFAGPSRSTETLFKYISPEQVPVQYGGLSKEDPDFTTADAATELNIKPASKETIEIPATEGTLLVWELRVLGWEVSYGAEFVPSTEGSYTVIIAKTRKFAVTDEPVVKNSFKIGEAGKVVLTIDNATSKKKKVLYRSKVKPATE